MHLKGYCGLSCVWEMAKNGAIPLSEIAPATHQWCNWHKNSGCFLDKAQPSLVGG